MADQKAAYGSEPEITLGLLTAVEENSSITQRSLASQLGIALGLANSYLKRCAKKGLIKVRQAPANRYSYYLTPKGFSEKSRLTAEFLSQSFSLYRAARGQYAEILQDCQANHWTKVIIWGATDLTDIVVLCAADRAVELMGIVDPASKLAAFDDLPVFRSLKDAPEANAVILAAINDPQGAYDAAVTEIDPSRVLSPAFMNVSKRSAAR